MEVFLQDSITGIAYDISDIVEKIIWECSINNNPSKLKIFLIKKNDLKINKGSQVTFRYKGDNVFYGFTFEDENDSNESNDILAYAQTRYLKNKDTYVFVDKTISDIFIQLCTDFKLTYKVGTQSTHILAPAIRDNKRLAEILEMGINETLAISGKWFIYYDDFDIIKLDDMNNLKTDLIISDKANLYGFKYKTSIDKDTYNQIKLIKENKDTAKREVFIVKDSRSISQIGTLQYFEKIDETANDAQIENKADTLLSLKKRETKSLKLDVLGDLRARAGYGVILDLKELDIDTTAELQYYVIENSTHEFTNNEHNMKLEMMVSF